MSIWSRFFYRREMDAELDEEIRSHLSMAQRDRVDRGESESDASINARREFGNVLLVKETTRDMWGWTAVENFARDLRHALRQLKKHLGLHSCRGGNTCTGHRLDDGDVLRGQGSAAGAFTVSRSLAPIPGVRPLSAIELAEGSRERTALSRMARTLPGLRICRAG